MDAETIPRQDFAGRLDRASAAAADAGLAALLVGVGPDLEYLAGYAAPALERLTALVVRPGARPVLLVPELELPRAMGAPGASMLDLVGWADGGDPYDHVTRVLGTAPARLAVGNQLWAAHLLALQERMPGTAFDVAA